MLCSGSSISDVSKLVLPIMQDKSRSDNKKNLDVILDISSDVLQLDFDSLVPKSIDRTSFEGAKVLNQVDKKFIAVVAGNTLAVVDQVILFSETTAELIISFWTCCCFFITEFVKSF